MVIKRRVALALLSSLYWTTTAAAGTGTVNASAGNGWSMQVDVRWVDGGGYRPVLVTVAPATPSAADRTLHLEFHARFAYYHRSEVVVSQDVDIPAGSAGESVMLSVPQHFPWQMYDLDVWEDGTYLKKLSQANAGFGVWQDWHEALPGMLVIVDKATAQAAAAAGGVLPGTAGIPSMLANPDTSALGQLLPVEQQSNIRYTTMPAAVPGQAQTVCPLESMVTVPAERAPQKWIDYTSLDLVCVSMPAVRELAAEHPRTWQAIRAWTAAGGNLLVSGAGADFAALAELEALLKLDRADGPGGSPDDWSMPDPALYGANLKPPFSKNMYSEYGVSATMAMQPLPGGAQQPATDAAAAPGDPPNPPSFLAHSYGLGMVVAAAPADLFAEPAETWGWILNSLDSDRWAWYRRQGLSVQRDNDDFWNWLVPGVKLAPVTAFRVLITLFVLIIGPLNYLWLRRGGRLHLLIIIVPLCALMITLGLFGYALVADGLGVRVRTRSYTHIDQRRGEAVCWARLSYYAGLAPSGGLTFPADVAVLPLQSRGGDEGELARRRSLIWSERSQNLASGWLASRTPTQMLTVRSRRTKLRLAVRPAKEGSNLHITNGLRTRIERLIVSDAEGKLFRGAGIEPDATATLGQTELGNEQAALQQALRDHPLKDPEGLDRQAYANAFSFSRVYRYSQSNSGLPEPAVHTSRLEKSLGAVAERLREPRTYVALVERSPEVEFGVGSPRQNSSLHVIVGRW